MCTVVAAHILSRACLIFEMSFPLGQGNHVETLVLHTSIVEQTRALEVGRAGPQVRVLLARISQYPSFPSWSLLHNPATVLRNSQGVGLGQEQDSCMPHSGSNPTKPGSVSKASPPQRWH